MLILTKMSERFSPRFFRKLHAKRTRPKRIIRKFIANTCETELPAYEHRWASIQSSTSRI